MPKELSPHASNRHAPGSRRFDPDAPGYDQRTGLPPGIAGQVAMAVVKAWYEFQSGRPTQSKESDTQPPAILELAAGTGELGEQLSQRGSYIALEGSAAMLEQAMRRDYGRNSQLILGDANHTWPVPDQSQDIIFISRAAHLLDPVHLRAELNRCGRPGSLLVLGRVEKDPDSPLRQLRQSLHQLLRQHGLNPRRGDRTQKEFPILLDTTSWQIVAADWPVTEQLAQSLSAWRNKPGLAGLELPATQQAELLQALEQHAVARFGDLSRNYTGTRRYVLQLARIHQANESVEQG